MNILRKKFQIELANIVHLAHCNKYFSAIEKIGTFIESYRAEYDDPHLLGELYAWKAWIYDQNKEYKNAIPCYQKALKYPNKDITYFNILALCELEWKLPKIVFTLI